MSQNTSPNRGQYDPGWNDPPKLQYNNSTNHAGKTKLNKRVPFPLQSGTVNKTKPTAIVQPSQSLLPMAISASSSAQASSSIASTASQPPIAIVPPMPQVNTILQQQPQQQNLPIQRVPPLSESSVANPNDRPTDDLQQDDRLDEINENTLEYCLNIFQIFIGRIQESTNVRCDEIQRRINLIEQMWQNNTLTLPVQRKLLKIAKALSANNFSDAIENHRALVVDHSNLCKAWGAALRQIILTIQDNRNPLSIENDSINSQQLSNVNVLIPSEVGITGDGSNLIESAIITPNNQLQNEQSTSEVSTGEIQNI